VKSRILFLISLSLSNTVLRVSIYVVMKICYQPIETDFVILETIFLFQVKTRDMYNEYIFPKKNPGWAVPILSMSRD
jgi:hypothetical protein